MARKWRIRAAADGIGRHHVRSRNVGEQEAAFSVYDCTSYVDIDVVFSFFHLSYLRPDIYIISCVMSRCCVVRPLLLPTASVQYSAIIHTNQECHMPLRRLSLVCLGVTAAF